MHRESRSATMPAEAGVNLVHYASARVQVATALRGAHGPQTSTHACTQTHTHTNTERQLSLIHI
eukprot:1080698-Alexandrium_andersonii.AAC.1